MGCDPMQNPSMSGRSTIYPTYFEQNSGTVDWGAGSMRFFFNYGSCSQLIFWKSTLQDASNNPLSSITYNLASDSIVVDYKTNIVDSTESCTIKIDTSIATTLTFTTYKLTCWNHVYGYATCVGNDCIAEKSLDITVQLATSKFSCASGSNIQQVPLQVSYPTGGYILYQHWGQTDPNLNQYYFEIDLTTLFIFSDSNCMKNQIVSCFLQDKQGPGPNDWLSKTTSNKYKIYLDTSSPITAQSIRIQCNSATGSIESYPQLWTVVAFSCSNVFTFTIKNYVFIIDDTSLQTLFATYSLYVSSSDTTKCPISSSTIMTGTSNTFISSQSTGLLAFNIPSTIGTYFYTIQVCDYRKEACRTSNNYQVTILCGSPTASNIATQNFQLGSQIIGVLSTVGTNYMTIKDSANCLLTYRITSQEYSQDNIIWKTSTEISIEDSTAGGRVLISLPSQIYYYRYKIRATRQTDSTKYAETSYNYVTMSCGPLSSVLQDQEKVYEYTLIQKVYTKNTLNFDKFICNPNVCCDQPITYQFYQNPWQSSSTISTNLLTNPVETEIGSNKYKYVVDVSLPRVIEFYIYGINSYGIKGFSTKIKITIQGECILNKVSYNKLQPSNLADHQNYLNFSYSNPDNVPYLWLQYEQAKQKNQDIYDMSSRFLTTIQGCALHYTITKIVDYSKDNIPVSITDYMNNIFLDSETGQLTFQYFQRPVNYLIYLKAIDLGSSQSSPITDYHVNLTVYPKGAKVPNVPPVFQYKAPDITQNIGTYDDEGNLIEPGTERVIVYPLPPVYDRELKPINLTLGGLTPWMKYYAENNSIVVDLDQANFTYLATFRILYKITDPDGLFTQGSFNINLIPKAVRNRTIEQILKDSQNWICSVSPKIYKVTEDGLLVVQFNMTMMTEFDHKLINQQSTKIYIIPAIGRDQEEFFDQAQLALNWTLLKFEKDTMFIQLYFEQSCEISPLETYDKIAIDFSQAQQLLYSGKDYTGVYDISTFTGIQRRLQDREFRNKIKNGEICPLTVFYTDDILPRQMDSASRQSSDSFSDFFAIVFIFCFIIGIIIGMFISDTIWVLLSSIRYLQICLHLPMLKTIFPSNTLRFMRKTLPLAHLDVANLIWQNYEQTVLPIKNKIYESDQSRYLGYNDFTVLNQTLKYALLLYIIFAILYCLFYFIMKLTFFQNLKVVEIFKDKKYILLFFNFFHDLILFKMLMFLGLFGFMEYLVQIVYIFSPDYTRSNPSGGHRFLAVLGLILIFIVMPIVYLYGYRIHYKIINENKIQQAEIVPIDEAFEEVEFTKQKYQSLSQAPYPNALDQTIDKSLQIQISSKRPLQDKDDVFEGGDQDDCKHLWQRQQKIKQDYLNKVGAAYYQIKEPQLDTFFYPFCILRRIIYIMIVFCAKNHSIQLWWMISLNLVSLGYVGYFRPMKTHIQNRVEYYNQLSAALVTLHLLYFAGLGTLDCNQKSAFGWSLIVILSFNCIMCLLSTILRLLDILKLFLTKCWTKNKIKKLKELLELIKKMQEEQIRQAEIEANDPQAAEKKIETMKTEGYSAAYILMQTVNKNKNKKRKIRQLVTIDMDKVKGDNGLKEIVELADEENSNGSLEQAIYQDEPFKLNHDLSIEMNIQNDVKQYDGNSSENEYIQNKKSVESNKHTCPPTCDRNENNHNCDSHHFCQPPKCKGHGHGESHEKQSQIISSQKDKPQNGNNGNENGRENKNENNDEDDFANNGPIYYDFDQEEIPAEVPKLKLSPNASISDGVSGILIQENSSRLMNLNDSTFSFIDQQKSDRSESVNSDLFGLVNVAETKIQQKQIFNDFSASQLSSQRQPNQVASNLSTFRQGRDDDSQINPSPQNFPPPNLQQIEENKKQESEKSSSNSSFENNGPIYYDFDN